MTAQGETLINLSYLSYLHFAGVNHVIGLHGTYLTTRVPPVKHTSWC